ncbi:transposase [Streptomyces sp. NPDC001046]|uniref:transposase n=1 Tax=Streptomyces sp. NPDC001046 TaxID=3364543 RepID=UPI0036890B41
MRLIVRKERPHPGAQLRLTDADGMCLTCFATNTTGEALAALELRHRQRARAEDRIRAARATALRTPPARRRAEPDLAGDRPDRLALLAWRPMLALTGSARLWEPRRRRLRLFSAAAQLVTTGRRRILRLARNWPWTGLLAEALQRLAALPNPG